MKDRSSLAIFTAALLVLTCFALLQQAQAAPDVTPSPDGCYSGFTTAEGCDALQQLTSGAGNTGVGWRSLFSDTGGNFNTGVGAGALVLNNADSNTAVGAAALLLNTIGVQSVGVGTDALVYNNADDQTAVGFMALELNHSAVTNVAVGTFAAQNNDSSGTGDADFNVAVGGFALRANVDGTRNTAVGAGAIESGDGGNDNTAVGELAGNNITGNGNTCLGSSAGTNVTSGTNNIYLGVRAGQGLGNENAFIRIGEVNPPIVYDTFIKGIFGRGVAAGAVPVIVDSNGKVGTVVSSRRFKHDIKPMDKASEAILAFKPVTFQYNRDNMNEAQFGLVAEDVEAVNPELVVYDECGEPLSVRYDAVNAMLLNEFLKEHKRVEEQQTSISQLKTEMQTMVAQLKEQAAQIQKVSAQLEVSKPAPQVVANKP